MSLCQNFFQVDALDMYNFNSIKYWYKQVVATNTSAMLPQCYHGAF